MTTVIVMAATVLGYLSGACLMFIFGKHKGYF